MSARSSDDTRRAFVPEADMSDLILRGSDGSFTTRHRLSSATLSAGWGRPVTRLRW